MRTSQNIFFKVKAYVVYISVAMTSHPTYWACVCHVKHSFLLPSLPSGPGWLKPLDQAVLKITYILIILTLIMVILLSRDINRFPANCPDFPFKPLCKRNL
jgi:hypothetical protein